jgi:hypothetical protein
VPEASQHGDDEMQKIRIEQHSSLGLIWIAAWLFTIGYLQLPFWQGLVALIVWPYFIGAHFSPLPH